MWPLDLILLLIFGLKADEKIESKAGAELDPNG